MVYLSPRAPPPRMKFVLGAVGFIEITSNEGFGIWDV
jgi:hypothetical protein